MVKIRIADIRALELDLDDMLGALPAEDKEKALRYKRMEDRLRCACGRTMIRALAAETGDPDNRLVFREYGKPFFERGTVQFSLSHSGDWVVLASAETAVGVDVERCECIDWEGMSYLFSDCEKEMIKNSRDPVRCFYRVWTVNEAFAKYEGKGLSKLEGEKPRIDYADGVIEYHGRKKVFQTWEKNDYTVSFCSEEPADAPHILSLKEWTEWRSLLYTQ